MVQIEKSVRCVCVRTIILSKMTCDLDVWQAGSPRHYLGQVQRSRTRIGVHCYKEKHVANVVGATSSEGLLVAYEFINFSI